jgi:hypothetical protein
MPFRYFEFELGFKSPYRYAAEDTFELACHASLIVLPDSYRSLICMIRTHTPISSSLRSMRWLREEIEEREFDHYDFFPQR